MTRASTVIALHLLAATGLAGQTAPVDSSSAYHALSVGGVGGIVSSSYRWLGRGPGGGVELTLTTFPEPLASGLMVFAAHLGPTLWLSRGDARPFLKAGIGGAFVAGAGFGGGAPTAYYGAGLLAVGASGRGIRLDWTRYCILADEGCLSAIEIGFAWRVRARAESPAPTDTSRGTSPWRRGGDARAPSP